MEAVFWNRIFLQFAARQGLVEDSGTDRLKWGLQS